MKEKKRRPIELSLDEKHVQTVNSTNYNFRLLISVQTKVMREKLTTHCLTRVRRINAEQLSPAPVASAILLNDT